MNSSINSIQTVNIYNNISIPLKICSNCYQNKALSEYNKDKTKSCKLQSCCKSCQSIKAKHYYNKNRQINANKLISENDIKTCSECKKQKLYTEFHKYAANSLAAYICNKHIANNVNQIILMNIVDNHFVKYYITEVKVIMTNVY